MRVTVLVPTTGARWPLLEQSLASCAMQSMVDFEVLVIGDGAAEETERGVQELAAVDPRFRYIGFPKHQRRGEPYRHQLIREQARGEVIGYLCDRDLMFPDHLATLYTLLEEADFAHSQVVDVRPDGRWRHKPVLRASRPDHRRHILAGRLMISLTCVAHTRAAYLRLPHGWRTTPPDRPTDAYMWQQFLAQDWCRAAATADSTVLWFKRGRHPGWPVAQRLPELMHHKRLLEDPAGLAATRSTWARRRRHPLVRLVCGFNLLLNLAPWLNARKHYKRLRRRLRQ